MIMTLRDQKTNPGSIKAITYIRPDLTYQLFKHSVLTLPTSTVSPRLGDIDYISDDSYIYITLQTIYGLLIAKFTDRHHLFPAPTARAHIIDNSLT
jgi:hypothetical protein